MFVPVVNTSVLLNWNQAQPLIKGLKEACKYLMNK